MSEKVGTISILFNKTLYLCRLILYAVYTAVYDVLYLSCLVLTGSSVLRTLDMEYLICMTASDVFTPLLEKL